MKSLAALALLILTLGMSHLASAQIIAHRGFHILSSENTMAAFQSALVNGFNEIEFDVIMTADGALVINHDFKIKPQDFAGISKTTDLRSITGAEVAQLKHMRDFLPIPTLQEFLHWVRVQKNPNLVLHLELKNETYTDETRQKFAKLVMAAILAEHLEAQVIVRSFDWPLLLPFKAEHPEIRRALLIGKWTHFSFWHHRLAGAESVYQQFEPVLVAPNKNLVTADLVQAWRKRGVRVNPYTVNTLDEAKRLLALGVDGVTTDEPERIRNGLNCADLLK